MLQLLLTLGVHQLETLCSKGSASPLLILRPIFMRICVMHLDRLVWLRRISDQAKNSEHFSNFKPIPSPAPLSPERNLWDLSNKSCFRCLAIGHIAAMCRQQIRCHGCFHYGHVARVCNKNRNQSAVYRPKSQVHPAHPAKGDTPDINVPPSPAAGPCPASSSPPPLPTLQ